MNTIKCFVLSMFCFLLTACPYKEIYKYQGQALTRNEIEITPLTVFFKKYKKRAYCTLEFKIVNSSSKTQKFNFQKTYLIGLDTLPVQSVIFEIGKLLKPKEDLIIHPNSDTLLGLVFEGNANLFKDEIDLVFSTLSIKDVVLKYKKV